MKFYNMHLDEDDIKQEYLKANSRCRYKTPEELENNVAMYILNCKKNKKPLTLSGLALFLGLSTQTLRNYEKDYKGTEYAEIIKQAKQAIEAFTEESLFDNRTCSGAKFSLQNNFGWAERQNTSGEVIVKLEDVINN